MTGMIQDPSDGSQWLNELLVNVHPPESCAGRACVVHHPSDHHMRGWLLNWRDDRGLMERLCPHGIGHPDPDDLAYQLSVGRDVGVHGCDRCCRARVEES